MFSRRPKIDDTFGVPLDLNSDTRKSERQQQKRRRKQNVKQAPLVQDVRKAPRIKPKRVTPPNPQKELMKRLEREIEAGRITPQEAIQQTKGFAAAKRRMSHVDIQPALDPHMQQPAASTPPEWARPTNATTSPYADTHPVHRPRKPSPKTTADWVQWAKANPLVASGLLIIVLAMTGPGALFIPFIVIFMMLRIGGMFVKNTVVDVVSLPTLHKRSPAFIAGAGIGFLIFIGETAGLFRTPIPSLGLNPVGLVIGFVGHVFLFGKIAEWIAKQAQTAQTGK